MQGCVDRAPTARDMLGVWHCWHHTLLLANAHRSCTVFQNFDNLFSLVVNCIPHQVHSRQVAEHVSRSDDYGNGNGEDQ